MSQLWPPVIEPKTLTSWVHDDRTAAQIPGMARALQLYGGLIGQMALDQVKDGRPLAPRPSILSKPDPLLSRFNFVSSSVRDWWVHGNTAALITARDARGFPSAVKYFPAHQWAIPLHEPEALYLSGQRVDVRDVIHVQRGTDPANPRRGLGVVEEHITSLKRIGLQEDYESDSLGKGGVPSVAVIAPQKDLTQTEADQAAETWMERFAGPSRKPAILPNGTEVKTLAWNPTDQQLVMARQLSLTDLANIMNLDPYYLGAPGSSHTYRSAGSMFVALIRTSLEPVMAPFEETWSRAFAPHGSEVRFARRELTRDDLATMVTTGVQAVNAGLMTVDEWRELMGWTPFGTPEAMTPRTVTGSTSTTSTPDTDLDPLDALDALGANPEGEPTP